MLHAQNTWTISLQYLKMKGRDEVDFWHEDKHQVFLQGGTINFGGIFLVMLKVPEKTCFQNLCNI